MPDSPDRSDAVAHTVVDGNDALTTDERLERDLNPGFPDDESGTTTEDPASGDVVDAGATEGTDPTEPPPTAFDLLKADYEEAVETSEAGDRSEDWEILPGRFHGRLGIRSQNVGDKARRKIGRELRGRGGSQREKLLNGQAAIIAAATSTMLMRDDAGEWVPLHEHPDCPADFRAEPITWDSRLSAIIGFDYPGTPYGVVRLVYRENPSALTDFFAWLDAWLKEDLVLDDEEEGEGGDRPT